MNNIFAINGVRPDIDIMSIERSAQILEGENGGTLKTGSIVRDIIGTCYNYALEIDQGDRAAYSELYEIITAPVENHTVMLPFGQGFLEFDAYVDDVSDGLRLIQSHNMWEGAAFSLTAMEPQRYYEEQWTPGAGGGNGVFTLDGVQYAASVMSLKRTGIIADKGGRYSSGNMNREIVGTYYNYSIKIDMSSPREYDRLHYALTAPVDSHNLILPYGQETLSFRAQVKNVTDKLIHVGRSVHIWEELTVDFTAMAPERT